MEEKPSYVSEDPVAALTKKPTRGGGWQANRGRMYFYKDRKRGGMIGRCKICGFLSSAGIPLSRRHYSDCPFLTHPVEESK